MESRGLRPTTHDAARLIRRCVPLALALAVSVGCATTGAKRGGVRYERVMVLRGDTLSLIASQEGVSVRRLIALNGLKNPNKLVPGQWLKVRVKPRATTTTKRKYSCKTAPGAPLTGTVGLFGWPVDEKWRVYGGGKKVYIGAPPGSPVWAAGRGKVTFVGWRKGYGLLVVVRHKSRGQWTRYGGLRKVCVKKGVRVRRGQLIALSGKLYKKGGRNLVYEIHSP